MKKSYSKILSGLIAAFTILLLSSAARSAPVIDVLVLYVDAAQQTRLGRDIDARIASYIEYSNQAFANSGVEMRLRLVGAEKVDVNYTYVTSENLAALRTNNQVARLRQEYGADLVTLINLRQPMSGGYVCGVAYVPSGNTSTGRFYSNAASAAFSLVGVDCGLNTFLHELGHNMGLGHSHAQNSEGGIWSWARGHGVQGIFSTIMAYPQSYGTRNQLQQLSNPSQRLCSGQACGVDRSQRDGADAATNLNRLGEQVAAFMPRVVELDSADSPTPASGAGLPPCNKPSPQGNLITNGEFDSLDGWTALFDASRLTQAEVRSDCVDSILAVTRRTAGHGDASQDLTGRLRVGQDYTFAGRFGISGSTRDTVGIALRIQEDNRIRYQYLEAISVTSSELTHHHQSFRLDASSQPDNVSLVIYGPQAGVNILADELVLLEVSSARPTGQLDPMDTSNATVLSEQFEGTAVGWTGYGSSRAAFSSRAAEGDYSLKNHSRTYPYSGLVRDVTGLFEPDISYAVNTQIYVSDSTAGTSQAGIWMYYVDDLGPHWVSVSSTEVITNQWQSINGSFVLSPLGTVTQMRLLVAGPNPESDFYIDDFIATQR